MDYFSELLDSYDKLKKRTFKLRYISEAEEDKKNNGESSQEDIDTASNKEAEKQAAIDGLESLRRIARIFI